jgi:hypothetical protein
MISSNNPSSVIDQPVRHTPNRNLTIHNDITFRGLPVLPLEMSTEYLERLYSTIHMALDSYRRVWAVRIDLRFPKGWNHTDIDSCEPVIERFWGSLKSQVEHDRDQAHKYNVRAHDTEIRYVWAREYGDSGRPHYHLLILFNADAYFRLGRVDSDNTNMLMRIQEAWCRALRVNWQDNYKLVHIPENPSYEIYRSDLPTPALKELFLRASYLCKLKSKRYGDRRRSFGYSRT